MRNKKSAAAISYVIVTAAILLLSFALILMVGSDFTSAITGFFRGSFGSAYSVAEILVKTAPLTLCGLSVAVGSKSGFTNIGAEGQFYIGAVVAT